MINSDLNLILKDLIELKADEVTSGPLSEWTQKANRLLLFPTLLSKCNQETKDKIVGGFKEGDLKNRVKLLFNQINDRYYQRNQQIATNCLLNLIDRILRFVSRQKFTLQHGHVKSSRTIRLLDKILSPQSALPQSALIDQIRKNWTDRPSTEFERLQKQGIIKSDVLDDILGDVASAIGYCVVRSPLSFTDIQQIQLIYARAHEIRYEMGDKYHFFLHGQGSANSSVNHIMHAMTRRFTPERYDRHCIPFRVPGTLSSVRDADDFFKQHPDFNNDHVYKDDLLSVDANWKANQAGECALYFVSQNRSVHNVNRSEDWSEKVWNRVFSSYKIDRELTEALIAKSNAFADTLATSSNAGTLYVICIPKDRVRQMTYRSHEYGKRCDCSSDVNEEHTLERLRKGEYVCKDGTIPSYRILTSILSEDNSVRVIACNALNKKALREFKRHADRIALEAFVYKHLREAIKNGLIDERSKQSLFRNMRKLSMHPAKPVINQKEAEELVSRRNLPQELQSIWQAYLSSIS